MSTDVLFCLLSFLIGVLFGREIDDLWHRLIHPDQEAKTAMHTPRIRTLALVLLFAAIAFNSAIGGLLITTRAQTEDLTRCVADYNQQFSEAYQTRLKPSQEAALKLDDVMDEVSTFLAMPPTQASTENVQRAIAEYRALRQKSRESAADNQYPPLPLDYCGAEEDR